MRKPLTKQISKRSGLMLECEPGYGDFPISLGPEKGRLTFDEARRLHDWLGRAIRYLEEQG